MISDKQRKIRSLQRESILLKAVSGLILKLSNEIPSLLKVSFTKANLSKDRSILKIYIYSSFGRDVVEETIKNLINYLPSIRSSLSSVASLRRIPKIYLIYDDQRDKINKIEKLLDSVKEDN